MDLLKEEQIYTPFLNNLISIFVRESLMLYIYKKGYGLPHPSTCRR